MIRWITCGWCGLDVTAFQSLCGVEVAPEFFWEVDTRPVRLMHRSCAEKMLEHERAEQAEIESWRRTCEEVYGGIMGRVIRYRVPLS